uniref:Triosephosphate isomerase n=1 Tax=Aureoumbra lagunensis TaxID=44058 RepID=A0A7S3JZK9_9STRA|mmetsp:Transcript_12895/g.17280  ORF Transcript_12895/g.17280 Transcript_12895/m.17280 type:complete len:262 (+) Transcript_12895:134-919(+)|eukprot:CAMPEP_0197321500 /NCGR_PEP_ID=MMETSP0891-20130614/65245_1 /TAXON_ID=44058 ORGANISM="Aureoumbra lagunensis, Strain CCMP1510" /NCGR_SAMPLE_ID=MMETSP0891 /ASSEMBLY_ACC=CAM_ASM_000534 /LENGTH=261 /DNA_ID=CAMNT_0042813419 /DNA_START=33 /DNA_END=818 /DNA_ORIENTATION=+
MQATRQSMRMMSSRVPIVGGNWKMNAGNGTTKATVMDLVNGLNGAAEPKCEVFLGVPYLYLESVKASIKPIFQVAAQNMYKETKGAYTGEISGEMLTDMGVNTVIIGHSERRDIFGETDELLGAKIAKAIDLGMTVVACCGEHKEERESGKTMDVLIPQLQAIADNTNDWSKLVIAYEPVWAIGTGLTATPQQAQETHAEIRSWLAAKVSPAVADAVRIQYGGSANDKNAADLAAGPDIDGFLVGGASLDAKKFSAVYSVF